MSKGLLVVNGNLALARSEFAGTTDEWLETVPTSTWSETILGLSSQRAAYHMAARASNADAASKVARNLPLKRLLKKMAKQSINGQTEFAAMEEFLRLEFFHLTDLEVSFDVENFDRVAESKIVNETLASYKRSGMTSLAQTLSHDYSVFVGVRNFFKTGSLKVEHVIPIECLPEIMMAAPVWFVKSKSSASSASSFITSHGKTSTLAYLYQMYNRGYKRGFDDFDGKDVISPSLAARIEEASLVFDHLVIATPYHHLTEWSRDEEVNIDPFLIGFNESGSHMYLLGRWSGTGVFPLICDMIADTMEHLRMNIDSINNIRTTYWERIPGGMTPTLKRMVKKMMECADYGLLFDYLRGDEVPEIAKAPDTHIHPPVKKTLIQRIKNLF